MNRENAIFTLTIPNSREARFALALFGLRASLDLASLRARRAADAFIRLDAVCHKLERSAPA